MNHIALQFHVVNSGSCPFQVNSAISREVALKLTSLSLKIMINCHSWISRFTQVERKEITLTLNLRKFCSLFEYISKPQKLDPISPLGVDDFLVSK